MSDSGPSLYERLGGYDAISAVANNLLPRLMADSALGRFWEHRGADGLDREKQLLVDFLCHHSGGPMYYTGRDMLLAHRGMKINDSDWECFMGHVNDTLAHFGLALSETGDVIAFIESTRSDIVET